MPRPVRGWQGVFAAPLQSQQCCSPVLRLCRPRDCARLGQGHSLQAGLVALAAQGRGRREAVGNLQVLPRQPGCAADHPLGGPRQGRGACRGCEGRLAACQWPALDDSRTTSAHSLVLHHAETTLDELPAHLKLHRHSALHMAGTDSVREQAMVSWWQLFSCLPAQQRAALSHCSHQQRVMRTAGLPAGCNPAW